MKLRKAKSGAATWKDYIEGAMTTGELSRLTGSTHTASTTHALDSPEIPRTKRKSRTRKTMTTHTVPKTTKPADCRLAGSTQSAETAREMDAGCLRGVCGWPRAGPRRV